MSGDQYSARGLPRGQATNRSSWRSQATAALDRPALRLGGPRRAGRRSCAAPDADTCDALERGGLRVTTTLDVSLQKIAEKWVRRPPIVPARARTPRRPPRRSASRRYQPGWRNLANKDVRNGALVADRLPDRRARRLRRQSADYYATSSQPEVPAAVRRRRQGLSASPARRSSRSTTRSASTTGRSPPARCSWTARTDFGGGYTPSDADNLERGPVRVRNALQFSLNIPSVKAMAVNGVDHVFAKAKEFGMQFQTEHDQRRARARASASRRSARSTSSTAYGTLANGGRKIGHTTILADPGRATARTSSTPYDAAEGQAGRQPAGGLHRHRHPGRQHQSRTSTRSGASSRSTGPTAAARPRSRPARTTTPRTSTPTATSPRRPRTGRADGAYALAVGVWNGNSDNTPVSTAAPPLFSIDVSTYVWQGFLQEASRSGR